MKNIFIILLFFIFSNSFAQTQKPELFILSVGVSNYQNAGGAVRNLKYAHKDAIDLAEAFKKQNNLYDIMRVSVLTNENATRKNIRKEFESFKKDITPNDFFVFIFSGHGLKESLITHDFDINDRRTTSLGKEELVELISDLNCNYVVLLDACHSGSFAKSLDLEGKAINIEFNKEEAIAHESLTRALNATEKANIIISSSSQNELSGECEECQNGYFIESILSAIEGKSVKNDKTGKTYSPDGNKDGFIYTNELDDYLKEAINLITKNKSISQNVISKPTAGYNFPIFKLSDLDNDGTADLYDECRDLKGLVNGCPDDDKDGIANKDDKCPNEKGTFENNGCGTVTRSPIPVQPVIILPKPPKPKVLSKVLIIPGIGSLIGGFLMQNKASQSLKAYNISFKQTEISLNKAQTIKYNKLSTGLWALSGLILTIDLATLLTKK